MDVRRFQYLSVILGVLTTLLTGCATKSVPHVNQSGYEVYDDEQRLLNRTAEFNWEVDVSGVLYDDPELERYLNRVSEFMLPEGFSAEHLDIRVKVFDDSLVNAYAMPDGRMYMTSAMLALMDNEAQLAIVIGHELTHILERHQLLMRRSSASNAAFFGSINLIVPFSAIGHLAAVTGFSQQFENQADTQGFEALLRREYAPGQALVFFQRIEDFIIKERIQTPLFFSSHPKIRNRITQFESLLNQLPSGRPRGNLLNKDIFLDTTRSVRLAAIRSWIRKGMFTTALERAELYAGRYPQDPSGYYLKGEVYRKRIATPDNQQRRVKDSADYGQALTMYEEAIAVDPTFPQAWRGKGQVLIKIGDNSGASEALRRYRTLSPQAIDLSHYQEWLDET